MTKVGNFINKQKNKLVQLLPYNAVVNPTTRQTLDKELTALQTKVGEKAKVTPTLTSGTQIATITTENAEGQAVETPLYAPQGGGGVGESKEHIYSVPFQDDIWRVKAVCANANYVAVATLKYMSIFNRADGSTIYTSKLNNLRAVEMTDSAVYLFSSNVVYVYDFSLNLKGTIDVQSADVSRENNSVAVYDGKLYAIIAGALYSIDADANSEVVVGYESGVTFITDNHNRHICITKEDGGVYKLYKDFEYVYEVNNIPIYRIRSSSLYSVDSFMKVGSDLYFGRLYNKGDIKIKMTVPAVTSSIRTFLGSVSSLDLVDGFVCWPMYDLAPTISRIYIHNGILEFAQMIGVHCKAVSMIHEIYDAYHIPYSVDVKVIDL